MRNNRPTIGVLIDFITEKYQAAIWKGVNTRAGEKNADLLCFLGGPLASPEAHHRPRNCIYDLVSDKAIDGLIILSTTIGNFVNSAELAAFHKRFAGIPAVTIGVETTGTTGIMIDNSRGMHELVNHLIMDHGYRKIAFIKGAEGNSEAEARFHAYLQALREHNIPFDPDLVSPGDFTLGAGARGVSLLVDKKKMSFEALVCANDLMAMEAIDALQKRNISVPQQTAVTGFDDIEGGEDVLPPLTTVGQPLYEIGTTAVDTVLDLIADRKPRNTIVLPTKMKLRNSCGCNAHTHARLNIQEDGDGVETVFHQSPQTARENAENRDFSHRLESENLLRYLHRISIELITSFNTNTIKTLMIQELPRIKIRQCYIFMYAENNMEQARAFFGYSGPARMDQTGFESDGRPFSASLFIDKIPKNRGKRFSYIVMALYFKNEQLGFIVFELADLDGLIYETLSVQISAALEGALLIEKIRNHSDELESEIRARTRELMEKNEELKKLDTLKNEFIANITHDFRSPLTSIFNTVDLALKFDRDLDARHKKNYTVMYEAALRLRYSIDRLLELAKMDAQGIRLDVSRINMVSFLNSIINYYKSSLVNTNIKIVKNLAGITHHFIYTDKDKLEEAIGNIVSNAVKFIDIKKGVIKIGLREEGDSLVLSIADNGIGIPPDKLKVIFNRFEQLQAGKDAVYGGTGIGLAYAKQLVEYMKGEIWAESRGPGKGASFHIRLPKDKEAFLDAGIHVTPEKQEIKPSRKLRQSIDFNIRGKLKGNELKISINRLNKEDEFDFKKGIILIIDDDENILEIIKKYLEAHGFENFIITNSGKLGLNAVYEYSPSIIICDYNIPDQKGSVIHDDISANPRFKHIPFIFLSAIADKGIIRERREKGASSYLKKPIDEQDLILTVEFHLQRYYEYLKTLRQATIDELTGIYNRRELLKRFTEELSVRRYRDIAVIFCDLDRFKDINDTYGHGCGDRILREFGSILGGSLREYDIAGRYGGDEFIIILPDTNMEQAGKVARILQQKLAARPIEWNDLRINIFASFGIASLRDNSAYIMKKLKISNLKQIFAIVDPRKTDWVKIRSVKTRIAEIILEMADDALHQAKRTRCRGCGHRSDKKETFTNGACPKCGGTELVPGGNKICMFDS
jgi:diguanylate cyclase (GGDEF)-like protein